MTLGHRHQMLRKRKPGQFEFRSIVSVAVMDVLAYIVSFLSLFFSLDQVRIIFVYHNASGVSLLAWSFYICSSSVWLLYGYVHRDKVLITTSAGWVVLNICVVIGILLYA